MAERLVAGRHHLSRDEVAAHQKQRLFKALATVMATNGYNSTTVDDVIKEAKVSRATFYQHFESKQDLFMSGYARMQRHVVDAIRSSASRLSASESNPSLTTRPNCAQNVR